MSPSPSNPRPSRSWTDSVAYLAGCRWTHLAVVLLILAGALFARTLRCDRGLPYIHTWGEPNIASRSLDIVRTGDLNPHWFHYGSPTLYLHAAVDAVCFAWMCSQPDGDPNAIRSLDEIETQTDTKYQWTWSHPTFLHWNRLTTALIGTLTVLLTYVLARQVSGRWAAALAAAIVAGAPDHIEVSTTIRTDMPAALIALGAVLAAVRAYRFESAPALLVSLFLAGLAASTKYNVVVALVAPFTALALGAFERRRWATPWVITAAFLIPPLAFFVGSPYSLLDLPTFLGDAGHEVYHYKIKGHAQGRRSVEPGLPHMLLQTGHFRENVSWLTLALAVPGACALLLRRAGWVLLVFPALYFVFMTRTTVDFHHNFAALYPFLGILGARGAEWVYARLAVRSSSDEGRTAAAAPFAAVLLAFLASVHVATRVADGWREHVTLETRTQAVELVNELAREKGWSRVGIAKELRMHRLDLDRLETEYRVARLSELLAARADFDALVCSTDYKAREAEGEQIWKRVGHMNRITPDEGLAGSIEGSPSFLNIRTVNPGVSVFALDAEPAGAD